MKMLVQKRLFAFTVLMQGTVGAFEVSPLYTITRISYSVPRQERKIVAEQSLKRRRGSFSVLLSSYNPDGEDLTNQLMSSLKPDTSPFFEDRNANPLAPQKVTSKERSNAPDNNNVIPFSSPAFIDDLYGNPIPAIQQRSTNDDNYDDLRKLSTRTGSSFVDNLYDNPLEATRRVSNVKETRDISGPSQFIQESSFVEGLYNNPFKTDAIISKGRRSGTTPDNELKEKETLAEPTHVRSDFIENANENPLGEIRIYEDSDPKLKSRDRTDANIVSDNEKSGFFQQLYDNPFQDTIRRVGTTTTTAAENNAEDDKEEVNDLYKKISMLQESINKEKEALSSIADEVRKSEEIRNAANLATEDESDEQSTIVDDEKLEIENEETRLDLTENWYQSDVVEDSVKEDIQPEVRERQERRSIFKVEDNKLADPSKPDAKLSNDNKQRINEEYNRFSDTNSLSNEPLESFRASVTSDKFREKFTKVVKWDEDSKTDTSTVSKTDPISNFQLADIEDLKTQIAQLTEKNKQLEWAFEALSQKESDTSTKEPITNFQLAENEGLKRQVAQLTEKNSQLESAFEALSQKVDDLINSNTLKFEEVESNINEQTNASLEQLYLQLSEDRGADQNIMVSNLEQLQEELWGVLEQQEQERERRETERAEKDEEFRQSILKLIKSSEKK